MTATPSKLDRACDELNAAIAQLEIILAKRYPTTRAIVPIDREYRLAWTDAPGEWGLYAYDANDKFLRLRSTDRSIRVAATKALPNLKTALDTRSLSR